MRKALLAILILVGCSGEPETEPDIKPAEPEQFSGIQLARLDGGQGIYAACREPDGDLQVRCFGHDLEEIVCPVLLSSNGGSSPLCAGTTLDRCVSSFLFNWTIESGCNITVAARSLDIASPPEQPEEPSE